MLIEFFSFAGHIKWHKNNSHNHNVQDATKFYYAMSKQIR